jgi:hypothetical protein
VEKQVASVLSVQKSTDTNYLLVFFNRYLQPSITLSAYGVDPAWPRMPATNCGGA